MKLRLFKVRLGSKLHHFSDKMSAKHFRNTNAGASHIMKGPDHIGNHGSSVASKYRRQPKCNKQNQ